MKEHHFHRQEHKGPPVGMFSDARDLRAPQVLTPYEEIIERDSMAQIVVDIAGRVHQMNVRFYGLVHGCNIPEKQRTRLGPNCKDSDFSNIYRTTGFGDNGFRNVDWFIVHNAELHE